MLCIISGQYGSAEVYGVLTVENTDRLIIDTLCRIQDREVVVCFAVDQTITEDAKLFQKATGGIMITWVAWGNQQVPVLRESKD